MGVEVEAVAVAVAEPPATAGASAASASSRPPPPDVSLLGASLLEPRVQSASRHTPGRVACTTAPGKYGQCSSSANKVLRSFGTSSSSSAFNTTHSAPSSNRTTTSSLTSTIFPTQSP